MKLALTRTHALAFLGACAIAALPLYGFYWITSMGVTFETLIQPPGNSVMRTHRTKGRGIGLVSPLFSDCARRPNISFRWNTRVDRLLVENGRVVGVAATNVRTQAPALLRGRAVVLATGGFQSNLEMVRSSWRTDVPLPEHFLVGSGLNSTGTGHQVAAAAGAALTRLDHQWNYITGLPDPRFPDATRGLNAYNEASIWVNAEGKRFLAARTGAKLGLPVLARQKGATYWSVFDEASKRDFWVAGSDWASFDAIEKQIFSRPELVKSAQTIEELAVDHKAAGPAVFSLVLEGPQRVNNFGGQSEVSVCRNDCSTDCLVVESGSFGYEFTPSADGRTTVTISAADSNEDAVVTIQPQ